MRHAAVDNDSPRVGVVEASDVDRLKSLVGPVDVVPHPVDRYPLAVVDACRGGQKCTYKDGLLPSNEEFACRGVEMAVDCSHQKSR